MPLHCLCNVCAVHDAPSHSQPRSGCCLHTRKDTKPQSAPRLADLHGHPKPCSQFDSHLTPPLTLPCARGRISNAFATP